MDAIRVDYRFSGLSYTWIVSSVRDEGRPSTVLDGGGLCASLVMVHMVCLLHGGVVSGGATSACGARNDRACGWVRLGSVLELDCGR